MFQPTQHVRRTHPARRLALIFAFTILAPGLILGVFGLRASMQERQHVEQETEKQLAISAAGFGHELEGEIRAWQNAVEELAHVGAANRALWPERVRLLVSDPGAGVVIVGGREHAEILPFEAVLYAVVPLPEAFAGVPPALVEADALEKRDKQYDHAIRLYRELLATARPAERPVVLHGLARTLVKAGSTEEAIRTYRLLAKEAPIMLGSLPSDFVALHEVASLESGTARSNDAIEIYRGLVGGRWRLAKLSYLHYAGEVREWLPDSADLRALMAEEEQKLSLTRAVAGFLGKPESLAKDGSHMRVAFWQPEPFTAIVLNDPFARGRLSPRSSALNLHVSVSTPAGASLIGPAPSDGVAAATYVIESADFPWRVQVWPKDFGAVQATAERRRNLYLGVLAAVVALLAFGSYFAVRTLRSELAIAQMKSDFVSAVSHEFRSPLAGISQLGEMLRDGRVAEAERRQEYYDMIVTEASRLRRLVENILDFSRMEDGRKQFRFEPLEPASWLRDVTEDFHSQVAGAGFRIESRIPEGLPEVSADREALATAVRNLLDNAVKYSLESKTVQVEARANGQDLSIAVRDHGAGIRVEDRPHIFEKFYRGRGEVTQQVKGVGLGLNLVQHIVAAHGGAIDFETREGEGSTFTIRLRTIHGANSAH